MPTSPPPPLVPLHTVPSPIEQEHIKQAVEATQTAMSAIDSLLTLSSWVLTVLALLLAIIAVFGWSVIRNAVLAQSKQIANDHFDAYVATDEFKQMVKERIAKSVDERWGNTFVVQRLAEDRRDPDEPSPFPMAPKAGDEK